jgi:hypothetical protein
MAQINLEKVTTANNAPVGKLGIFVTPDNEAFLIDESGAVYAFGGGATSFLALSDVPASYTGQAGKVVTVNVGENALVFTEISGAGTVTSVAVSGTDGLQVDSGSPITGAGTITLGVDAVALRAHINVANGATANTGTVTSVAISGTDGIEVDSGSPITGAGTITLGLNASTLKTLLGLPNGTVNGQLLRWNNDTSVYEIATDAKIKDDLLDITITDGVDTSYIYNDPTTFQLSMEGGAGLFEWNGSGWNFVGGLYIGGVSADNRVVVASEIEAEERENDTVLFDKNYVTGNTAVRTGNILFDFTGAKLGSVTRILHNSGTKPTIPSQSVLLSGEYTLSVDNYIYFCITDIGSGTEKVEVTVSQVQTW